MTVAFLHMFGILERWNNNQVTPSLSKPHELSYRSNNIMIDIEHFEKLLTLLKTIEDDQNININIQRKPRPLNGVDAASQKNIDMYR